MVELNRAQPSMFNWKIWCAFALAISVCVTGYAVYRANVTANYISKSRQADIFKTGPVLERSALQREIARNPLQADLLYGLIASRVQLRKGATLTDAERTTMQSLGWRSTALQIALMRDGIARVDEQAVLARIDGLLRRGKLTDQLVTLLVQIEQTGPKARSELVQLLANQPAWRHAFLVAPAGFGTVAAVSARAATLDAMFDKKLGPKRDEVAPVVNRLEASGAIDRSEKLWRRFQRIGAAAPLPFDPRFTSMAADPQDAEYQPMAFEWRSERGSGYSAQANRLSQRDASLMLRWDGRGAPVFLRQRLIAPQSSLQIVVKGPLLDRSVLQRVGFILYCGSTPNFYDRLIQLSDGDLAFVSSAPNACRNPELRMVGLSENSLGPIELELSTIRIVPDGG
ncbi:hypothetical protein [Sphingopyxis sp. 2PD]|uniref:hypothetical protein n=1 Tax=Sphingopyxis sp. 2PD TaxID=2502196 RepID=UPI0010F5AA44|nr:hypothetical protein [Sphingopyxis sp. 2PD]